jgi:hypothetical protein
MVRRFLVQNGIIDSLDLNPDQVSNCVGILNGEKPSITVDQDTRPHVVWETQMRQIHAGGWPNPLGVPYGRNIGYRARLKPFSDASSAKSWTPELLFEVRNEKSYNPVIGSDRMGGDKLRIVWQTDTSDGRVHAAVGHLATDMRMRTLPDTGTSPVISLNTSGDPLGLFAQPVTIKNVGFKKFFWSQDTARFDFAALPGIGPVEMRGGAVANEQFTIGLAMSAYEDSATGDRFPFIPVSNTAALYSHSDLAQIVRTDSMVASRLRFDIRRFVHGFDESAQFEVFDTASVSWYAQIRNAVNDTLVASVKLGGVEKDSSYAGIDSAFVVFIRQPVYVQLQVETNPIAFPCPWWIACAIDPNWRQLDPTQKRTHVPAPATAHLEPNIPNPFSGSTTISFTLSESVPVRLTVHDMLGREVALLKEGQLQPGRYSAMFFAGDLPSGSYLCRLQAGATTQTRIMLLVR